MTAADVSTAKNSKTVKLCGWFNTVAHQLAMLSVLFIFWMRRSFKWSFVSRDACDVSFFHTLSDFKLKNDNVSISVSNYTEFKFGVLSMTQLASQLKVTKFQNYTRSLFSSRIKWNITMWKMSDFKTEWYFVIIYTKLKLCVLNCSPCSLNMVSLFGCSSGPLCSNMGDLYMMNYAGPEFWHIVLSWESLAKMLNSP